MNRAITKRPVPLALGALAGLVIIGMSVSVVPETKQAIISTYGQPLRVVNGYKPKQQFGERFTGLAFRILEAGYRLEIPKMFAALLLLAATGVAIHLAFAWLSRAVLRHWHQSALERER